MPTFPFTTVDVFTTKRYEGNPLAIVKLPAEGSDHDNLSTQQMQTVAGEFNLSETVFIHESTTQTADGTPEWRIRIFLTNAEVPFAGHPTIGAACYAIGTLAKGAKKGRFICNAGPIDVDFEAGVARASIPHNFHRHTKAPLTKTEIGGLQERLGVGVQAVDVVSPVKGMNFTAIRLASVEDLGKVGVTGFSTAARLDGEWDVGFCGWYFYVLAESPSWSGDDGAGVVKVRTRMSDGTMEDAATGSGACGLCCFLAVEMGLGRRTRFEVVQGVEMGRRSEIGVEITLREGGEGVEKVVLMGSSVGVMEGRLEV